MADLSDDVAVVPRMVELVNREGYDIVCASREHAGGRQIGGPRLKGLLSRVAGLSLHWVAGLPTHDATNAFRLSPERAPGDNDREPGGLRVLARDHRQGVLPRLSDHRSPLDMDRPIGRRVAVQASSMVAPLSPLVFLCPIAPAAAPFVNPLRGFRTTTCEPRRQPRRSISENLLVREASDGHRRRGVPGPAPGPPAGELSGRRSSCRASATTT